MKKNNGNKPINRVAMYIIDVILFGLLLFADQCTKYLAIMKLKGNPAYVLYEGVLELDYLPNAGIALGMLQGQKFLILFVGVIFIAFILFFLLKVPAKRKFIAVHILLVMVIAGGIGNMIDRFRFDFVVDFISFVLINYPIFNVADCYITIAAVLLFILFLFVYKENDLDFLDFKQKKYREFT